MDNVFVLPNGMLSNGQRVIKLTKTQQRLGRQLAKMDDNIRNLVLEYSTVLGQYVQKVRSYKPKPLVRDNRLD